MKLVAGFEHRPGVHCGSTAMSDVLRHQGHDLSEAMCFGLGSGIGLAYLRDFGIPSRVFHGRTLAMERDLCDTLGVTLVSVMEPDPGAAWRRVRAHVDGGLAVVLQTDVRFLPHYRSTLPFNGHRVVLAGYDPADEAALVADTQFEGFQRVPQADLRAARGSDGPPAGPSQNLWWEIAAPRELPDLGDCIRRALRRAGAALLASPIPQLGIGALEQFAAELPDWGRLPDAKLCAQFGYQVIEKRGTGGALFRRLYHRFLVEAATRVPAVVPAGLPDLVAQAADAWTTLAHQLREAAVAPNPDFAPAATTAARLVTLERQVGTVLTS